MYPCVDILIGTTALAIKHIIDDYVCLFALSLLGLQPGHPGGYLSTMAEPVDSCTLCKFITFE